MLLEFKTKKEGVLQKKKKRYEELKVKNFQDSFIGNEENEFNELEKWLKIHNDYDIAN